MLAYAGVSTYRALRAFVERLEPYPNTVISPEREPPRKQKILALLARSSALNLEHQLYFYTESLDTEVGDRARGSQ